ncbi:MAG: MFS transporter [Allosphingosinicella sp.]
MTPAETGGTAPSAAAYPPAGRAWRVVLLLLLVYSLAYVDRQILSLAIEPMKRDLDLSDTQISLLIGLAFSLTYAIMGLPAGRLADCFSRSRIITVAVLAWSAMTSLFGFATSFGMLFLARLGVGVGEAPLNACAMPLISDLFPKERLGRALGIYMLGASIGAGLTGILGGHFLPLIAADIWVDVGGVALRPWQLMFVGLGAFGLLVGLATLAIGEPVRHGRGLAAGPRAAVPVAEVAGHLRRHWIAYLAVMWPISATALMVFGASSWIPSFFIRSYGLTVEEAGGYIRTWGVLSLVFGMLGVIGGGLLTDRLVRKYKDGYVRALTIGAILALPGYGLFALMPTPGAALTLFALAPVGAGIMQAASTTSMMMLTPNRMRSQVAAFFFLIVTLIGSLSGPTLIAALTDYAFADEAALRYSIALVAVTGLGSALVLLGFVRSAYRRSVDELADEEGL